MFDLNCKTTYLLVITTLIGFVPNIAFGENLNLTGNLNVNDTQMTSTSSLLLSMLVSLAESIIPIVVGATVGHKSITYWHEKKDRIATKNNILANYTQSFKLHSALLDDFVDRVFKAYIVFQKDDASQLIAIKDYTDTENNINSFLKFASDPGELPSKRFVEEYKDIVSKIENISHARNRLYLDLKLLHKGNNEIIEKLHKVENLLVRSELVMSRFFHSTNNNDFINFRNSYLSLSNEVKNQTDRIELELVQLKLN